MEKKKNEKISQLDFYAMENDKVLYNLMELDSQINLAAPYIRKAFSDNRNTCNLFKMGAKTNSGFDYLRKPSNGYAHIRLEMFGQCLYGRFTRNIGNEYEFRNKDDEFGIDFSKRLVLATEDILSFKKLTFIFSINWEDKKPVSVRIWYWDKIRDLIDIVYENARKKNNMYCIFKPEYDDFPLDNSAKKYYDSRINDFFVDWKVYGCNEKAINVKVSENGIDKGISYFSSLKDFVQKYNGLWNRNTISNLLLGKMDRTRVKILEDKKYVLKRVDEDNLEMEILDHDLKDHSTLDS